MIRFAATIITMSCVFLGGCASNDCYTETGYTSSYEVQGNDEIPSNELDPFGDDPFEDDPFADDPFEDDPFADSDEESSSLETSEERAERLMLAEEDEVLDPIEPSEASLASSFAAAHPKWWMLLLAALLAALISLLAWLVAKRKRNEPAYDRPIVPKRNEVAYDRPIVPKEKMVLETSQESLDSMQSQTKIHRPIHVGFGGTWQPHPGFCAAP